MKTGIFYHESCLLHNPGKNHPERPARLENIISTIHSLQEKLGNISWCDVAPASINDISLVHTKQHIDRIKEKEAYGGGFADDEDTVIGSGTFKAALYAAGACISAGNAVIKEKLDHALILIRPPGHHATHDRALGFCIFNNVAILAKWLLRQKVQKIAIVDWDAHHGNGTQDIFYKTKNVLYVGLHQDGRTLYPGTGFVREIGADDGVGYNVNIPFPPHATDKHYFHAFKELILPILMEYSPDIVLVSAGYDAHFLDSLSNLYLTAQSYWKFTEFLKKIFSRNKSKIIVVLEGGYNLYALSRSVVNTILALNNKHPIFKDNLPSFQDKSITRYVVSLVKRIKNILQPYWHLK